MWYGSMMYCNAKYNINFSILKLKSVSFASLSLSLFESYNCSYLRNYQVQYNKNCHRKMPSEQVSNMSATFVLTNVADMLLTCSDGIFRWKFLFGSYFQDV